MCDSDKQKASECEQDNVIMRVRIQVQERVQEGKHENASTKS
jgi:hypothetical protein